MKKIFFPIYIVFLILVSSCEGEEVTSDDYVPPLNFLLLHSETKENLLSATTPPYVFDNFTFYIEADGTTTETFALALKQDATYGPYVSVELFDKMLWEDFLANYGTSFSQEYKLKLSDADVETVKHTIKKIPPTPRLSVFFNGTQAEINTSDFVIFEKTPPTSSK